jgi:hypothetical protein
LTADPARFTAQRRFIASARRLRPSSVRLPVGAVDFFGAATDALTGDAPFAAFFAAHRFFSAAISRLVLQNTTLSNAPKAFGDILNCDRSSRDR